MRAGSEGDGEGDAGRKGKEREAMGIGEEDAEKE